MEPGGVRRFDTHGGAACAGTQDQSAASCPRAEPGRLQVDEPVQLRPSSIFAGSNLRTSALVAGRLDLVPAHTCGDCCHRRDIRRSLVDRGLYLGQPRTAPGPAAYSAPDRRSRADAQRELGDLGPRSEEYTSELQ